MRTVVAILIGAIAGASVALPLRHFVVRDRRTEPQQTTTKNRPGPTKDPVNVLRVEPTKDGPPRPKETDVFVDGMLWISGKPIVLLTDGRELRGNDVRAVAYDGCLTAWGEVIKFRPKRERRVENPPRTNNQ